jgi:competence protein ComFA
MFAGDFIMKVSMAPPRAGEYETVSGFESNRCPRCGGEIGESMNDWKERYCRGCIAFGMVNETTVLYLSERAISIQKHSVADVVSLTPMQKEASRFLVRMIEAKRSAMLHAVCGAGKTEILFEPFRIVLERGGKVCLAIPRKDIVIELARRLAKAFPQSIVRAMTETEKDDEGAHIVVSTIHQLIHYQGEFDLVVVDEADAFPYRGSELLERLLQQSRKPGSPLFKMSATADASMREWLAKEHGALFLIPARYHGQPLDIPRLEQMGKAESGTMPMAFRKAIEQQIMNHRQTIIFVPTIALAGTLAKQIALMEANTVALSSKTQDKHHILERFRKKAIRFIVSTSILERGVTFLDIDVFVYQADADLFDGDTLVQIAGRVGRSALFPSGLIVFFAERKTKAMIQAIQQIRRFNAAALKLR